MRLGGRLWLRVDALHEIRPPDLTLAGSEYVGAEWAARWPVEDVWLATKT